MIRQVLVLSASIALLASGGQRIHAQAEKIPEKTVWNGVYTAEQATRGKKQYEANCSDCHSIDLSGGEGRPLRGDVFMRDWSDKDLRRLFDRARTMPPGAGGSLSDDTYIEILAYLLQANSFPAGSAELKLETLKDIHVEGRNGPGVVPNFSLVQSIGCLSEQGADGSWLLTRATSPARTNDSEQSKEDQLKLLQLKPLGSETVRLMYVFPSPASLRGHKIEAKGLLIREPGETRINVTSLQSVSPACGQ